MDETLVNKQIYEILLEKYKNTGKVVSRNVQLDLLRIISMVLIITTIKNNQKKQ